MFESAKKTFSKLKEKGYSGVVPAEMLSNVIVSRENIKKLQEQGFRVSLKWVAGKPKYVVTLTDNEQTVLSKKIKKDFPIKKFSSQAQTLMSLPFGIVPLGKYELKTFQKLSFLIYKYNGPFNTGADLLHELEKTDKSARIRLNTLKHKFKKYGGSLEGMFYQTRHSDTFPQYSDILLNELRIEELKPRERTNEVEFIQIPKLPLDELKKDMQRDITERQHPELQEIAIQIRNLWSNIFTLEDRMLKQEVSGDRERLYQLQRTVKEKEKDYSNMYNKFAQERKESYYDQRRVEAKLHPDQVGHRPKKED